MSDSTNGAKANKPVRRIRSIFENFAYWAGPILAGFNVATHIVGFFSVGALASWIIERWLPFTRWAWEKFFHWLSQYLFTLEFTDTEKDALTTALFFTPLGAYAWFSGREDDKNEDYRLFGAFVAVSFLAIVGANFLSDYAAELIRLGGPALDLTEWPRQYFAYVVLFMFFASTVLLPSNNEIFGGGKAAIVLKSVILIALAVLIIWILAFIAILSELNFTQTCCFILVVVLASISAVQTPYRLSIALGAVFAFVFFGLTFELVIFIGDFINSVTDETQS